MTRFRHALRAAFMALFLATLAPIAAAGYTSLTIFGDSLSDTGNVSIATGGAVPTAPYFNGRFSDGPVWVEHLAAGLGLAATPSLAGGGNDAFGGARTGAGAVPVPGLLAQAGGLWAPSLGGGLADATGLFVLAGGGNNMRDARSAFAGNTLADEAGRQAAAVTAANDLIIHLTLLASHGVQNVLLANLPDLGLTPEAVGLGLVPSSSDASARFNALMPSVLDAGTALGLNMLFLDMADLTRAIHDDALTNGGAAFGITNALTPCGGFTGSIGISCDVSLFSDALHPSAVAHRILGDHALRVVNGGINVPEPSNFGLLLLALAAASSMRRRKAVSA